MATAYHPVYTIISFYLRVLLFTLGIVVLVTAALTLNLRFRYYSFYYSSYYYTVQFHEGRFAIFAGVFTVLFAGILNIVLSFVPTKVALDVITVIDFLTAWFLLGSGIATARLIEFHASKALISVCCAFSFVAMAVAATLFAFDLIELLALRNRRPDFAGSPREHPMTFATLKSNPFRPHSTVAYSNDQSVNPDSTNLEHTESTAKPVGTEPTVDGYVDTTAPTGIPDGAQHEPKPAV